MSKPLKIILGVVTMWPLIYILIFMTFWFYMVLGIASQAQERPSGAIPSWFLAIFVMHGITMLVIFALLTIYIINVFTNDRVAKDKKALWAVVLFLGNAIAMPIYWYFYIWPSNNSAQASQSGGHL